MLQKGFDKSIISEIIEKPISWVKSYPWVKNNIKKGEKYEVLHKLW